MKRTERDEVRLLARLIELEAGGESDEGQLAVAYTVRNRWDRQSWYGKTLWDVMTLPYQYSCFNDGLPYLEDVPEHYMEVAGAALSGRLSDPTGGATHYYAPALIPEPAWAPTMEFTVEIGGHRFYKE